MLKSEIRESKSERIPKSGVRSGKPSEFGFRTSGFGIACCSCSFVVKNKNPTAVWQWGSINLVNESEPDRRATQPQRVQQQVQIQIAIHNRQDSNHTRRRQMVFRAGNQPLSVCHKGKNP